eukprot:354604_1
MYFINRSYDVQSSRIVDRIQDIYENAFRLQPQNTDLLEPLFQCYTSAHNHVKQQQIALKMHKYLQEPRYLFWAVCCMELQVPESDHAHPVLRLGRVMLEKAHSKFTETEKDEDVDENCFILYVQILRRQRDFAKAV